jgi:hypothetical protein
MRVATAMTILPIRFSESDLRPVRAYARLSGMPVSSAVKDLTRRGLAATGGKDDAEMRHLRELVSSVARESQRIDDLIRLSVQLLTIARVFAQASDRKLLETALQSSRQTIAELNLRPPQSIRRNESQETAP